MKRVCGENCDGKKKVRFAEHQNEIIPIEPDTLIDEIEIDGHPTRPQNEGKSIFFAFFNY